MAGMGARDFVVADTDLSFTRVHNDPKRVHSVTISIQPQSFKVTCYGRIVPGSFHAPVLATESVAILGNLADVLGKLTGIGALRHRHL